MEITIDRSIFLIYPDFMVSGLVVTDLNWEHPDFPSVDTFYLPDPEKAQKVCGTWKELYKTFIHDKKARASIEYLTRASTKQTLKHIHPVVDLYNQASLLSLSPFGGEDIEKTHHLLKITHSQGTEPFVPLGKDTVEIPQKEEIIWVDGKNRVVCRAMNYLESDIHKITKQTRHIIFVSERPINSLPDPQVGIDFLLEKLKKYSSSAQVFTLDPFHPSQSLENLKIG